MVLCEDTYTMSRKNEFQSMFGKYSSITGMVKKLVYQTRDHVQNVDSVKVE